MEDIQGKLAEELVQKCPTGVFDIEDVGTGTISFSKDLIAIFFMRPLYYLQSALIHCNIVHLGW